MGRTWHPVPLCVSQVTPHGGTHSWEILARLLAASMPGTAHTVTAACSAPLPMHIITLTCILKLLSSSKVLISLGRPSLRTQPSGGCTCLGQARLPVGTGRRRRCWPGPLGAAHTTLQAGEAKQQRPWAVCSGPPAPHRRTMTPGGMLTPSRPQAVAATGSALTPPLGADPFQGLRTPQFGNSPNIPASVSVGQAAAAAARGRPGCDLHAKPQNSGSNGRDQLKTRQ